MKKPLKVLLVAGSSEEQALLESLFLAGIIPYLPEVEPQLADGGQQALTMLAETPNEDLPDLIITDMKMPGMNGRQFTERVRLVHRLAQIPVIITSSEKPDDPEFGIDRLVQESHGQVVDHLPKPIRNEQFIRIVGRILRGRIIVLVDPADAPGQRIALMARSLLTRQGYRVLDAKTAQAVTTLIGAERVAYVVAHTKTATKDKSTFRQMKVALREVDIPMVLITDHLLHVVKAWVLRLPYVRKPIDWEMLGRLLDRGNGSATLK